MALPRPAPDRIFVCIASFAALGVVVDLMLLTSPLGSGVPALLIVLKYLLAIALTLVVLAAGRAIRRAEAACLEDLHD